MPISAPFSAPFSASFSTVGRSQPESPDEGVEVLDAAGKPLLVMPQRTVLRQNLRRHLVFACLRNPAGQVYLHKRGVGAGTLPGMWFPAVYGHVPAGASRYETAANLLAKTFGISKVPLVAIPCAPPPETGPVGNVRISLFMTAGTSALPRLDGELAADGMFVDREELRAVLRDFPHMVAPMCQSIIPYLFPRREG